MVSMVKHKCKSFLFTNEPILGSLPAIAPRWGRPDKEPIITPAPTRRRAGRFHHLLAVAALAASLVASAALALETPIGRPQIQAGMEIAAVYLQPVPMEPAGMMKSVAESDIHLEADVHAQSDNHNGFPDGAWIPYLGISYEIMKQGGAQMIAGELMPMVANDGPHYGDNVKLSGPGKYTLKLSIAPPQGHFGRHTDKETGVGPWFKPFTVQYDFTYAGIGKKGGY
jgi:periplasmic iron binding protein